MRRLRRYAAFEPRGFFPTLTSTYKNARQSRALLYVAEREGFEPSIGFILYALSRGAPSATRPSLRILTGHVACRSV